MSLYVGSQKVAPVITVVGGLNNQDKTITQNGVYTADSGYTGLGEVTVEVSASQPVINSLNVTPTTSAQTITAPTGVDGYSPVNVSAVSSSIDSNIVAGNIKKDVSILGVTGSYEGSGGVGVPREIVNGVFQMPSGVLTLASNATDLGGYAMFYAFYRCTGITAVIFPNLTTISSGDALEYAFRQCTNLTSVDLSSLTTVSGGYAMSNAFDGCTNLTSVDLSSLTTISGDTAMGSAFTSCSSLSSVNFPSLSSIVGMQALIKAFQGCTSLTTLSFPSLTSTSFGSYTDQFNRMLSGVNGCTVHFPSNLQSVIGSWSSVTSGFGGTNTVVLFDLPATT